MKYAPRLSVRDGGNAERMRRKDITAPKAIKNVIFLRREMTSGHDAVVLVITWTLCDGKKKLRRT